MQTAERHLLASCSTVGVVAVLTRHLAPLWKPGPHTGLRKEREPVSCGFSSVHSQSSSHILLAGCRSPICPKGSDP